MASTMRKAGTGWVVFSGIMLILLGFGGILDGIWALDNDDKAVDTFLFENDIGTWGVIYLVGGIIVALAGFAVMARAQWARYLGIFVAAVYVIVRLPWIFSYPEQTLLAVILGVLVLYGLSMYGGDEAY
jgi:hypothetical protein